MSVKTRISRRLRADVDKEHLSENLLATLKSEGVIGSLLIAMAFFMIASTILAMRSNVIDYRPGQFVNHDIVARVPFNYPDKDQMVRARERASDAEPRVYRESRPLWEGIERDLLSLPERTKGKTLEDLKRGSGNLDLAAVLDKATLARLQEYAERNPRPEWDDAVRAFVGRLRQAQMVLLPDEDRRQEIGRNIRLNAGGPLMAGELTFSPTMESALRTRIEEAARDTLPTILADKVVKLTLLNVTFGPTHEFDEAATKTAQKVAADKVPDSAGCVQYGQNQQVVTAGPIREADWARLRYENDAYHASLGSFREYAGLVGAVAIITIALGAYVARYQPRIMKNNARGVALAVLLLATLLVAQLAGIGSGQLFFVGVVPTILVAMTLAIAYDQRFAMGMSSLHAALVTLALSQPVTFFLVLLAGSATCAMTTHNLRSRSQLINIGAMTGLAMMVSTLFAGLMHGDPVRFIITDALWAALSGLVVGFFVLGVMPFVEHVFRISTGMSLLELADLSHPLLRKLATEAPGTYQHSMQVSVLAEEAANMIGANALLTRVGAYYHDVGKINKAEYFIENQTAGMQNRHLQLNPNVSMLIIVGHVKDGIALAREYHLPTVLFPFIQSHHGTTLVEYFFHRAKKQHDAEHGPEDEAHEVDEHQFRYPGPKPRSKEVAILMMADAAESACRTIDEPSAARIETLVHDILIKRLLDGQFDECDITMKELELIERSMIRTLIGIYHARIAYPSNAKPEPAEEAEPEAGERRAASAG
ncbi:MAG: HDIG domain-containing protein [Tepidisphaeraceae bacterium]